MKEQKLLAFWAARDHKAAGNWLLALPERTLRISGGLRMIWRWVAPRNLEQVQSTLFRHGKATRPSDMGHVGQNRTERTVLY
jgi:hypothetical protein